MLYLGKTISILSSGCHVRLRSIKGRYLRAFLASRATHRRAITLENRTLPYCVVFPAMINSHVRFIVVAFIPCARARAYGKRKRERNPVTVYFARLFPGIFDGDRHITYLYPYDDDGNSNDSIFLPRRQGAYGYTRGTTFAYDESKTITIQSLCSVSFACHRLPCRALHTATAVG